MTRSGSMFRNNLFDFDFEAEAAAKRFHDETIEAIDFEEMSERVDALRKMSRRALDEDRMDAYFRIQDYLDSYASEPAPTPAAYGIPEVRLSYVGDSCTSKPSIACSRDIFNILRDSFEEGEIDFQEFFKVIYLSRANKVLGIHTVSKGGMTATVVDERIVFTGALLAHADAIILCHNHPSGNTLPSCQDDELTRNIIKGGKILHIRVLDHIIVTSNGYYSYQDNGKI